MIYNFTKSIETEIIINSKIDLVWKIFTDFDNYSHWNPFIKTVEGTLIEGEKINVTISPPNGKEMKFNPVLLSIKPLIEFRWKGKLLVKGIFDGEHYFILNKINEHQTMFIQGEIFNGILIPLLGNALRNTKLGFQLMNEALKNECEKLDL